MTIMFKKYYWLLALCICMACTKEQAKYPYNNLVQFSIDNVEGSTLKGVIQDDQIIVYWPPYLAIPDSVSPGIITADKALVLPASGSKVAFTAQTTYTVTAQDGSKKTYHLKPVINQPLFYIRQLNTTQLLFGDVLVVGGDFFIPDTNQTKVYIVGSDKKEIQLHYGAPYDNVALCTQTGLWLTIPSAIHDTVPSIPFDSYRVKVVSGLRTITFDQVVKPAFMMPYATDVSPSQAAAGDVVTLTAGRALVGITGATLVGPQNESTQYTCEIISYNKDAIKIKLPAGVPAGEYWELDLKSTAYGADVAPLYLYDTPLRVQ